jgi:hypothetical protein
MLRGIGATVWLVLAIGLAASAAPAVADTTLGSTLEDNYQETAFGSGTTAFQEVALGETLTAPANGLITTWKVRSGDEGAEYELRILRPNGGEYTNAGTSSPSEPVPNINDEVRGPFPANLLVRAGDRIGLYVLKGIGAPTNTTSAPTDEANYVPDPFAEGSSGKPGVAPLHGGNQELLLQANFRPGAGPPPPPENSGLPIISGEARQPERLTGTAGFWRGNPTAFTYQWLRCAANGAGCESIAGATTTTYTLTRTDVGSTIRLHVTATGPNGASSADSAPTVTVAPFVIRAVLKMGPNPTCTGLPVSLDASGSSTPDPPIVSYRYDYIDFPSNIYVDLAKDEPILAGQPSHPLFFGSPKPDQVATFTWDRGLEDPLDSFLGGKPGDWVRDNVRIILSIQDKAGAVTSTAQDLLFSQRYSSEPRTKCPHSSIYARARFAIFSARITLKASATGVTAALHCTTAAPCAGALQFLAPALAARGAARRPSRRVVLATAPPFTIAGHHTASVRAGFTNAGRRFVKRGRAVRALMRLTSVGVTGTKGTRTVKVTLHRK